ERRERRRRAASAERRKSAESAERTTRTESAENAEGTERTKSAERTKNESEQFAKSNCRKIFKHDGNFLKQETARTKSAKKRKQRDWPHCRASKNRTKRQRRPTFTSNQAKPR